MSIGVLCASFGFMEINAKEVAPDVYSISFGKTEIVLEGNEVKILLLQLMQVLPSGGASATATAPQKDTRVLEFLSRIKTANDVGIQKLLLVADHNDLLTLLKSTEDDTMLRNKFFGNMSEKNRTMFIEDLTYEFRDGLLENRKREALKRLIKLTHQLEMDGDLIFE